MDAENPTETQFKPIVMWMSDATYIKNCIDLWREIYCCANAIHNDKFQRYLIVSFATVQSTAPRYISFMFQNACTQDKSRENANIIPLLLYNSYIHYTTGDSLNGRRIHSS